MGGSAVTARCSQGDYHPGGDQWRPLGTTGIFAWALAIAPTKDNYWSTDVQTGSAYGDHATVREPHNRLRTPLRTLFCVPPRCPTTASVRGALRTLLMLCFMCRPPY